MPLVAKERKLVIDVDGNVYRETVSRVQLDPQSLTLPQSIKMLYAAKPGSFIFSLSEGWGYLRFFRKIHVISSWYLKDKDPDRKEQQVFVPEIFHPGGLDQKPITLSDPFPYALPDEWVFAFFGFFSTVNRTWSTGLGAVDLQPGHDTTLPMYDSLLPNVYDTGAFCFGGVDSGVVSNHYEERLNQTIEAWVAGQWNADLLSSEKRKYLERWFMFDEDHNHTPDYSLNGYSFRDISSPLVPQYPFPEYSKCAALVSEAHSQGEVITSAFITR